ncbi:unnamed protein product [Allacma fusca]|uniref:Ras GTPase-activating protein n=1 Tax=Allacma fusca TaxID=39272 RepID=A0A8J2JEM7_9HEXA|nr:unnamed protein product [Allacma fusca]
MQFQIVNVLYPSRLRTSRSHESLLAWTNNPNNFVNNGMMSTVDLTAGDVVIRTLHPSILGQDFAFQVITPSGSKYYSCSSGPERDAWVHALRQAIKPHSDEIRRQESSLKLWILEAKGMPGGSGKHSKRFFCELYLDDVLYARTCAKPRGEMLFWGEHFEFSQLPNCVQLITVVFFREGDKKRKKERNTCIGKVKIPVNTVNSRYLIEKWYPVIPESGSSQTLNKDKDGPSLRIKCKFQSVDILPLRCYRAFLQYVKDEYGPVSECLETVLSVKAKEDLASAMVHVLHHEGLAKEFIAELALQEILKSGDEKLTFRGNSIATKAMEAFLKLTGTEYLHATLGSFIEQFQNAEDVDCEIDPMKLPQASSSTLNKNQQNLRMAIDNVWKYILHSDSMFPMELRECFAHCREALKSAGKEDLSDHLISASIFLRFLCPAILSPSLFNITNEYPTEKSARNLTLVAKILQTLANFTRFQGKENYMEFVNDFVEREAPNMKEFLARISSPLSAEAVKKLQKENRDKVPAGGFIDLGKYLSVLSTLLSESIAKIAPKNDRFKQLQEILENIHLWLKQPANATNVSMFPFPHLTSPPPTVPPPPAPIGIHNIHINHHPRVTAQNPQAVNHQYQVPHHNNNNCPNNSNSAPQPIYAVSNVIHNTSNPNVKNISQVHIPPLQLQIPPVPTVLGLNSNINNPRSGSQASSGYQSQSPVLEGCEEKSKKTPNEHVNDFKNQYRERKESSEKGSNQNSFNNANFENSNNNNNRKFGSQSVDDLSSLGVEPGDELGFKKRLTRSSSSSDCEYAPTSVISNNKSKTRSSQQKFNHHALLQPGQGNNKSHSKPKMVPTPHHRLSRRSSAELLRKNHPYSSSTDEDSDSGHNNVSERDDSLVVPQLPPRRLHGNSKRSFASTRPNPDGSLSSNGEKSLEEYEREMLDLRRAMEALQLKLNRAEERLFGHDSSNNQSRRESDIFLPSAPSPNGGNSLNGSGPRDRLSLKSADENSLEMDHLLQRLLCAEEEMKREQELLTALDRKQKLIDAQEQKIARLDAVNNQLLEALAQIRDSLQQQHVLAQQQKIQMQLQKQQQHLQSLASGSIHVLPASPTNRNFTSHHHLQSTNFNLHNNNNNNNSHSHTNGSMNNNNGVFLDHSVPLHMSGAQPQATSRTANNTTKVLITSDSSGESGSVSPTMSLEIPNHAHDLSDVSNPRDSATFLGEQALKMLAELKSSSC